MPGGAPAKCVEARPGAPLVGGIRVDLPGSGLAAVRGGDARKRKIRASGGCLGTERRGRTRHAAKSPGEMRAIGDPGISEWGNPPRT